MHHVILIINESGSIENSIGIKIIKIYENYTYEESGLLKDRNYNYLLNLTRLMDKGIKNSYDVVKYWMIGEPIRGERIHIF